MNELIQYILDNFLDILIALGGFTAIIIYILQRVQKKREAAALIVLQIEELKEKVSQIRDITLDNSINEKTFYETLDIITDNQWEKYKHLFVKKIDMYSFKQISSFYEYILKLREQLLFVKQLQHQQYFNIQSMLNYNCNSMITDLIKSSDRKADIGEVLDKINTIKAVSENEKKQKKVVLEILDDWTSTHSCFDSSSFWTKYSHYKDLTIGVINSNPYISYVPVQVSETFNKAISHLDSIEVIGCLGYKKLKKIAKIK